MSAIPYDKSGKAKRFRSGDCSLDGAFPISRNHTSGSSSSVFSRVSGRRVRMNAHSFSYAIHLLEGYCFASFDCTHCDNSGSHDHLDGEDSICKKSMTFPCSHCTTLTTVLYHNRAPMGVSSDDT